jgi:hypothetical protein
MSGAWEGSASGSRRHAVGRHLTVRTASASLTAQFARESRLAGRPTGLHHQGLRRTDLVELFAQTLKMSDRDENND